ncbi:hypothetical protein Sgou_51310 [Streptomyces gougerotii]|uniref:Fibronectin type III-like domain-containing protein n=1 Tax=Streptomyces gougerotii TaxID=53448 RepID=A0ABQ1DD37_9ACTN|nr:hypothetical protein Sgou_51310 [Streptomyces gougerotii]
MAETTHTDGRLDCTEGVFAGHAAWDRAGTTPAYPFGHGLGYTDWSYETLRADGRTVSVGLRNTGTRPGRETVQLYLAPPPAAPGEPERPAQRLAGFALAEASPGEATEVTVDLPDAPSRPGTSRRAAGSAGRATTNCAPPAPRPTRAWPCPSGRTDRPGGPGRRPAARAAGLSPSPSPPGRRCARCAPGRSCWGGTSPTARAASR